MTLVLLFYANGVRDDLKDMRVELFHHLTNAELHVPRATVVSKDEWVLTQLMWDKQMSSLMSGLCEIKVLMQDHIKVGGINGSK